MEVSEAVRHQQLLLRPSEVAEMLGLSRSKIFELLAAGELPVVRIGRATRVAREGLELWVAEQTSWQPRAGRGLLHRLQARIEAKSH
jgi:excisionase family DNA binding protein